MRVGRNEIREQQARVSATVPTAAQPNSESLSWASCLPRGSTGCSPGYIFHRVNAVGSMMHSMCVQHVCTHILYTNQLCILTI